MTGYHRPSRPTSSSISTGTLRILRSSLRALPLLCAAWCGNALATTVIYQGAPGSSGLAGATPGAPGTAGVAALPVFYALSGTAPVNSLTVNGGAGGAGGNGANGNPGQDGGAAGAGGAGGAATAVLAAIAPAAGGTLAVTANGGAGGNAGQPGIGAAAGADAPGGAGGSASANGVLTSSDNAPTGGGGNAQLSASSTALAGAPGNGTFSADGGNADANVTVTGYGRVSGTALATGNYGGVQGGYGNARAIVGSNDSAVASATANGGGAFFNPGAPATARAEASAGWHASAEAVAQSGSGRFGNSEAASAIAQATVDRVTGTPPPAAGLVSEARAHAQASFQGGQVLARSSYVDASLGASVVATASSAQPAQLYQPEAYSAANVGGAAYDRWTPVLNLAAVASYASALPDPASLTALMAASPNIDAAFDGAQLLGAGTVGAMFFPFTATAAYNLPFTAGRHLLLGLGLPFTSEFDSASFEFSVSNGATELYAGSFTTPAQAGLFADHVLDLGVIDSSTLDLLVRFTLNSGLYGFSYVLGAGDALTPVPEPGTWLMLVLGLAWLTWRACKLRDASVASPHGW